MRSFIGVAGALALLLSPHPVQAQNSSVGTWLKQPSPGLPNSAGLMMTVEPWGKDGLKLIYRLANQPGSPVMMTVESPMDGTDAAVIINGKPSGETMGIKRTDAHHSVTILKMNGKQFATSRAMLSADFKTLTVENEVTSATAPGMPLGKTTETWIRK